MILYNVTVKIDSEIEEEWITWMRNKHIPDVMDTGCFTSSAILRLKFPVEDEGVTFAIQYSCPDMKTLEQYHAQYAIGLQKEHSELFKGRFVSFRTVLEEVD